MTVKDKVYVLMKEYDIEYGWEPNQILGVYRTHYAAKKVQMEYESYDIPGIDYVIYEEEVQS